MKGLLIHKPILKGVIDHAEINLFAQIIWMSRNIMKSFEVYKNVLCIIKPNGFVRYGKIYGLSKFVLSQTKAISCIMGGFRCWVFES